MASIRRTLSPMARAGGVANAEIGPVGSPLSRSSSSPHSSVSSLYSRASTLARSKPKGQLWRRMLLHFLIFFLIGVSIGLILFALRNMSTSLMLMHQDFIFDAIPVVGNYQQSENVTTSIDEPVNFNGTLSSAAKEQELISVVANNISNGQLLSEEPYLEPQKLLIVVTPTSTRPFQAYYLHRLAQTLKLVQPPLLWIVVEMTSQSDETAEILRSTGIMYRHLICKSNLTNMSHRSIFQRNVGLTHIETHRLDGILYFADEDNIYSVEPFQKMREIRRFGTWTVAKLAGDKSSMVLQGPVCNGSQVIGWHTNESNRRSKRFHAEMPGFAFNSTIIWDPKRWHRPTLEPVRQLDTVKEGFWVSTFIEQVVEDEDQMECLMRDSSSVMVWHIDFESSHLFYPPKWTLKDNLDAVLLLERDS